MIRTRREKKKTRERETRRIGDRYNKRKSKQRERERSKCDQGGWENIE